MDSASSLIYKKPKLSLSPPPPTKLCLICYSGEYQAYIVDYSIEDADGDGDSEFVKRHPNIRFKNFGDSCFCMADSTIYIFSTPDAHAVGASSPRLVYSYKLLPETSDVTLDADRSLFAGDEYGDNRIDFEIYDTKNNTVEELPKLLLRNVDSDLQFFDIETKTWKPIYGSSLKRVYRWEIEIEGFSVINDRTFVVLTDFNRMFCLDLVCPFKNGWQLYEGVTLVALHQTFVTESGFNVDACGVFRTTQAANLQDLTALISMDRMGGSEARVCFPPIPSSFPEIDLGSNSCMCTFVEGDPQHRSGTVFVAKTMLDDDDDDKAYPYWIVDKLALDFEKLPAGDLDEVVDDEWAKCVASHKSVGEEKCLTFVCLGLFPF